MIASCSEDTVIWNEDDRVKAYSAELVGKHADLIDHLDRVLRACEYRDRVLGGEDSQIVIDRYFSDMLEIRMRHIINFEITNCYVTRRNNWHYNKCE